MAISILRPNSVGLITQLSRNTGSSNWSAVDDVVANNDTDYVYKTSSIDGVLQAGSDAYRRPAFSTTGVAAIIGVTVYAVCKAAMRLTNNVKVGVYKTAGGAQYGSLTALTASYATYSKLWTTSPFTSVAWTAAELAVGTGVQPLVYLETMDAVSTNAARCTQIWMEIEWTPVVGKITVQNGSQIVITSGQLRIV